MSRKTKESKKSAVKKEEAVVADEKPQVMYADVTNRLFASMLDLAVIYLLVDFLSQAIFNAIYPGGSEYIRIQTQIVKEYPELAAEPGKVLLFIMTKYTASMNLILNQMGLGAAVQIVLVGCYYIPMTKIYGATLGKMMIGMKVVDGITGKEITWSQSIVRYICYMPSVFILGLGVFSGMISRRKRCWHDSLADTCVIYSRDRWYKRYFDKLKNYFHLK